MTDVPGRVSATKGVDNLQFNLIYQGPLPAAQHNSTRAKDKQRIRRVFHDQLAVLWSTHPALQNLFAHYLGEAHLVKRHLEPSGHHVYAAPVLGAGAMTHPASALFMRLGGFRFLPLVTRHLSLIASVHIDFLAAGPTRGPLGWRRHRQSREGTARRFEDPPRSRRTCRRRLKDPRHNRGSTKPARSPSFHQPCRNGGNRRQRNARLVEQTHIRGATERSRRSVLRRA